MVFGRGVETHKLRIHQSVDGGLQHGLSSEPHGPGPVVLHHSLEERTQGSVFLSSFELTGQLG